MTPVIAITANVAPADRDRCLAVGMTDYLAKPIHEDDLRRVLRRFQQTPSDNSPPQKPEQGVSPKVYKKLAALFITEAMGMVDEVASALAANDTAAVRDAAHKIKGALMHFAAAEALQISKELEQMAKDDELFNCQPLAMKLKFEVGQLLGQLKSEIDG